MSFWKSFAVGAIAETVLFVVGALVVTAIWYVNPPKPQMEGLVAGVIAVTAIAVIAFAAFVSRIS